MSKNEQIEKYSNDLFKGIVQIVEQAKEKVALVLNTETTLLYWNIGYYINENLRINNRLEYGAKILATLSQQLSKHLGKGYSYSALTRMCKVVFLKNKMAISNILFLELEVLKEEAIALAKTISENFNELAV